MSEYQFVHFLALDGPLDDGQLEFMERQSSRAEITRWQFTNEYHFGDFHGDAREMLRRGYDVHLHFANFGIRRLMIRLPAGLPCERQIFNAFAVDCGVQWIADKKSKGGILEIEPEADAGTFDYLDDVGGLLQEIAPVRAQLIGGDLRALYLAWLACNYDEEALEPPVPAGLGKLPSALKAMARFYEVGEDLIAAAAEQSAAAPDSTDAGAPLNDWIAKQSPAELRKLVNRLLANDAGATRAETLARVRDETGAATWPMAEPTRTIAQLRESAEGLGAQRLQREQQARDAARRKRLKEIAAAPSKVVAKVEKLVKVRSTDNYQQAATELAELREALDPEHGPATAQAIAKKLRAENPTLGRLIAALRKQDLLD